MVGESVYKQIIWSEPLLRQFGGGNLTLKFKEFILEPWDSDKEVNYGRVVFDGVLPTTSIKGKKLSDSQDCLSDICVQNGGFAYMHCVDPQNYFGEHVIVDGKNSSFNNEESPLMIASVPYFQGGDGGRTYHAVNEHLSQKRNMAILVGNKLIDDTEVAIVLRAETPKTVRFLRPYVA